jgi:hypothetical protein
LTSKLDALLSSGLFVEQQLNQGLQDPKKIKELSQQGTKIARNIDRLQNEIRDLSEIQLIARITKTRHGTRELDERLKRLQGIELERSQSTEKGKKKKKKKKKKKHKRGSSQ